MLFHVSFSHIFFSSLFVQDLTAINVNKTGHRKRIMSESAKLEETTVFPKEKPVSIIRSEEITDNFNSINETI